MQFLQQMYDSLMILPPSYFVYIWKPICSQKTERKKLHIFLISKFEMFFFQSKIISPGEYANN